MAWSKKPGVAPSGTVRLLAIYKFKDKMQTMALLESVTYSRVNARTLSQHG